jgi:NAD(P)-dependent dehydrogenase (short-subunit alcohol dehydrogenase family)
MGFSDAFGTWYGQLSDEEKARYLEGVPLRRIGDPEKDIGSVVAFLISQKAGFVTGRTIFVDGGRSFYDR